MIENEEHPRRELILLFYIFIQCIFKFVWEDTKRITIANIIGVVPAYSVAPRHLSECSVGELVTGQTPVDGDRAGSAGRVKWLRSGQTGQRRTPAGWRVGKLII